MQKPALATGPSLLYFAAVLPVKPWNAESVVRLFASVFLCYVMGSILALALAQSQVGKLDARFLWVAGGALAAFATTLVLLRSPWKLETFRRRLVLTGLSFYAGITLSVFAERGAAGATPSMTMMLLGLLCFQGAALVLTSDLLRSSGTGWREAFGLTNNTGRAVLYGLIAGSLFLPAGWLLQYGSTEILKFLPGPAPEEQQAVKALRHVTALGPQVLSAMGTILLAPVAEEVLFRGILYTWIRQLGFQRLALWLPAVLFAGLHYNRATFIPLMILAIVLARLYERTGNLLAPIVAHSFFNALNFILLFVQQAVPGT